MMATGAMEELARVLDCEPTDGLYMYVMHTAADALRQIGPDAVPALVDVLLRGANPLARGIAARTLASMEPPAREAIPALIAALDDPGVGMDAAYALAKFGKDAAAAVPRLCEWLCSDDVSLRPAAASALEGIGMLDAAGRAHLRARVGADRPDERREAARILTMCDEPADTVLPTLIELASKESESFWVDTWMTHLGSAAVPKLVESLGDRDPLVRSFAAEALGKIGPAAKDAVSALIALLDDHALCDASYEFSGEVRAYAIESLGRIGLAAAPAIPRLATLLDALGRDPSDEREPSDEHDPLMVLITALGRIGPAAREVVPTMIVMTRYDDRDLREAASVALARIEPDSRYLVPCLKRRLAAIEFASASGTYDLSEWDDDEQVADVIWELGAKADSLVPNLRRMVFLSPLLSIRSRCHAAYALARFPAERPEAVGYLRQVSRHALSDMSLFLRGATGGRSLATNLLKKVKESVAAASDENASSAPRRWSGP